MYARHAEIRVGLLVIGASLALLGLLFYATGGGIWGEWRYVTLRFRPGNLAPREGDPIQVNGVKVGTVDKVDLKTEIREGDQLTAEDKARIAALRRRDPDVPEAIREVYVEVVAKLGCDIRCPVGTRGEIGESVTQTRYLILIPGSSPLDLSDEDTKRHPIPVTEKPGLSSLAAQVEALTVKAGDAVVTADEALGEIRDLVDPGACAGGGGQGRGDLQRHPRDHGGPAADGRRARAGPRGHHRGREGGHRGLPADHRVGRASRGPARAGDSRRGDRRARVSSPRSAASWTARRPRSTSSSTT